MIEMDNLPHWKKTENKEEYILRYVKDGFMNILKVISNNMAFDVFANNTPIYHINDFPPDINKDMLLTNCLMNLENDSKNIFNNVNVNIPIVGIEDTEGQNNPV